MGDLDVLETKLPQIDTKYLCHAKMKHQAEDIK